MIEARAGLYTDRGQKVPLLGVEVRGNVFGGYAHVAVRQRYKNAERKPVEAIYTFPLPSDGTLTGFSMTCNGRTLQGVVKAREEAFREYDEAITAGHGAALLDQERPNVFTAQVGNLLPDEETLIEVTFVEKVRADEGVLRWSIPTLVAPRYIPGTKQGDRTGHGEAEPTDRVPDADRITPPIGQVDYGLKLDVVFDLGRAVTVESPSHAISTLAEEGGKVRVRFSQPEVALDRDVVITARGADEGPFTTLTAHKQDGKPGAFAFTVVPDLFDGGKASPQEVVFLIDTSGSMEGASIEEARSALRLCLRHLRENDRFNIISFSSGFETFAKSPQPYSQKTLEQADRWVSALSADGGTELLAPLLHALKEQPDGVVVLLTDGQVGNEAEILKAALAERRHARVYSFGIGTNVSDVLLRDLARETHGAVEFIHPGERIDEKVTAQFARAIAPRIEELTVTFHGVEVQELSPAPLPPMVDGEPWVVLGRYERAGEGRLEIKGARRATGASKPEPFTLTVPVALPGTADAAHVEKLWARERIRDLERAQLTGRRAESNKERMLKLALEFGVVTELTSFVVVEQRSGDRLATGQPETRVVPVNVPAGWDMFKHGVRGGLGGARQTVARPSAMPAPAPMAASAGAPRGFFDMARSRSAPKAKKEAFATLHSAAYEAEESGAFPPPPPSDPITALLSRQLASGLWEPAPSANDVARAFATAKALLELLELGVTTSHAVHGAQVRKAITALAALLPSVFQQDPKAAELAAGVAWLVATGPRSRAEVTKALKTDASLQSLQQGFSDEAALRVRLQALRAQLP